MYEELANLFMLGEIMRSRMELHRFTILHGTDAAE